MLIKVNNDFVDIHLHVKEKNYLVYRIMLKENIYNERINEIKPGRRIPELLDDEFRRRRCCWYRDWISVCGTRAAFGIIPKLWSCNGVLEFLLNIIGTELVGGDGDDFAEFPSCCALTSIEQDDESDKTSKKIDWFL